MLQQAIQPLSAASLSAFTLLPGSAMLTWPKRSHFMMQRQAPLSACLTRQLLGMRGLGAPSHAVACTDSHMTAAYSLAAWSSLAMLKEAVHELHGLSSRPKPS